MPRPPKGTRRALRLASMTASVAGGFARNKVAGLFRKAESKGLADEAFLKEAGLLVAATLGDLKGAAMKVGQMASTAADLLPPEIAEALATLQKQAPPMDYAVIAEQIEAELGEPPELLFERFDREPFAAASIGQVHRARVDGREVVVKVQYPGVGDAVDSDLSAVRRALKLGGLAIDRASMDELFDELRDRLNEELDYCREADNLRRFAALHDEPWLEIPEVVPHRSSGRVLTLTYIEAEDLSTAATWPQDIRDLIGARMVSLVVRQLFEFGEVHGDPHPGNYGFRADGGLVLFDFGCTRAYESRSREACADLLRAARFGDAVMADQALLDLGVRAPEKPSPGPEFYDLWLDLLGAPMRGPHDFGSDRLNEQMMEIAPTMIRHVPAFRGGAEIAILKRVAAGIHDNLKALHATVDLADLAQKSIAF